MGLKEKLDSLFKKQPSPAELERMDKKKIDADRARTEDLRARIDAASAFVTAMGLPEEESAEIRKFYRQTSECMREIAPTSFDVSGIDRYVDGIVTVLERAMIAPPQITSLDLLLDGKGDTALSVQDFVRKYKN